LVRQLSVEEKAALKMELFQKVENGFEQMFGDGKLDALRTFVQKDDQAGQIVDEIWQWMMEKHIEKDEQTDLVETKRMCPFCGGIGKSREEDNDPRGIVGTQGSVSFKRESFYCGRCRKVFFPSGPKA